MIELYPALEVLALLKLKRHGKSVQTGEVNHASYLISALCCGARSDKSRTIQVTRDRSSKVQVELPGRLEDRIAGKSKALSMEKSRRQITTASDVVHECQCIDTKDAFEVSDQRKAKDFQTVSDRRFMHDHSSDTYVRPVQVGLIGNHPVTLRESPKSNALLV